jgi:GAF domain-containing protein
MNFWRTRTLKQYSIILLVFIVLGYLSEHAITNRLMNRVDEAELKIEYTQSALQANQHISLLVQQFLNGNANLSAEVAAQLDEQEYRFKTLTYGGRAGSEELFISPLSRLPRITLDALKDTWKEYRTSVLTLLAEKGPVSDTSATRNAQMTETMLTAKVRYEGLSLSLYRWYDKLVVDLEEQVDAARSSLTMTRRILMIANILLASAVFFLITRFYLRPLDQLRRNIEEHRHTDDLGVKELNDVATQANITIENLKDATDFVSAIGKGDLSMDYKETLDVNYIPGSNRLADSLIQMQSQLRNLNEEEKKRQWANEGLARFVDIMRSSYDNLAQLGDKIVSALVTYTNANQGALYLVNDEQRDNIHLELISLFAFDIKKYEQQVIKPGQGIIGQTFLEKDTIYLTDLPNEYVRITSGLGGANPKAVLIVPLKVDTVVYGLVELASFNEFMPHEIAFVEKLGETIGSTLASVRAAQRNKQLIEQFQQQTEEMRAQEEEMRQNMEELQATQEEIVRKERSYVERIQELESQQQPENTEEVKVLRNKLVQLEKQFAQKVTQLEQELAKKPPQSDDWQIAEEAEKALRVNLEALRITQEELSRRSKS